MKTLKQILADLDLNILANPKGTDKGDAKSYVDGFYEREFARFRGLPNNILEIGVRTGASLRLWAEYFPRSVIFGVDNESAGEFFRPVPEWTSRDRVRYFKASAYDEEFARSLPFDFDIIIDDGPHTLRSQQRALELYLPRLRPGGVFIVEDVRFGHATALALSRSLPPLGNFVYETHDFIANKGHGDDFLFVVRNAPSRRPSPFAQQARTALQVGPWALGAAVRKIRHLTGRERPPPRHRD